jgi:tetratricopeptide (TPR) repeat protein
VFPILYIILALSPFFHYSFVCTWARALFAKWEVAMSGFLRLLVLSLLVSTSSITLWAQNFIKGTVRFDNGQPATYVVVRLRSERIVYVDETKTDDMGKFTFDGLVPSTYHLSIEGQGFKPYSSDLDITVSKMAIEQITLRLDKDPNAKEGASAGSVNARIAQIPPKAHKEFDAGQKSMQAQDAAGSLAHFQKAIDLYPQYAEAYQLLGVMHMQSGKFADAEPELQKATDIEPNLSTAYFALGVCRNVMAKYPEAETALLKGLELDPQSADGHYQLGNTYWALGRWQDAEQQAQKAVTLKPDMAGVHVLEGDIALRKHDLPGALKEYKEGVRLDPKGPMAAPTQQMISKIEQASQAHPQ